MVKTKLLMEERLQSLKQADLFDDLINLPRMQERFPVGSLVTVGNRKKQLIGYLKNQHGTAYIEVMDTKTNIVHSVLCESIDPLWENKYAICYDYRLFAIVVILNTKLIDP